VWKGEERERERVRESERERRRTGTPRRERFKGSWCKEEEKGREGSGVSAKARKGCKAKEEKRKKEGYSHHNTTLRPSLLSTSKAFFTFVLPTQPHRCCLD